MNKIIREPKEKLIEKSELLSPSTDFNFFSEEEENEKDFAETMKIADSVMLQYQNTLSRLSK